MSSSLFPVAPAGDFVSTHAVWVPPRSRQEVTTKSWRARPPKILELLVLMLTMIGLTLSSVSFEPSFMRRIL